MTDPGASGDTSAPRSVRDGWSWYAGWPLLVLSMVGIACRWGLWWVLIGVVAVVAIVQGNGAFQQVLRDRDDRE